MHVLFVLYKIKLIVFFKAEQKYTEREKNKNFRAREKENSKRQNAASCVESRHTHTQTNKS